MAEIVDFKTAKKQAQMQAQNQARQNQEGQNQEGMKKTPGTAKVRFEALDILRGLFLIGMLLANNAGDWAHIYAPLDHADWHGFTLADLVFPGFMVCVGLSMSLSLGARVSAGGKRDMMIHALRRAGILIALGLFLNLLPNFDLAHWRIPGVLQRIGIGYGIAAMLLMLHSREGAGQRLVVQPWPLAAWAGGVLLAYGLLLRFVPVPGYGANHFDAVMSWPAYVDRLVFGPDHVWREAKTYDPEGLLSTFPAVFNILAGLLVGLLIKAQTPAKAVAPVALIGLVLTVAGLALDSTCPIIKKLWTPSFALLSSGLALLLLSALMLILDKLGHKRWAMPIRVFGTNAILAYVFAWLFAVLLDVTHLYGTITDALGDAISDPYLMSLSFAVLMVIVCWLFVLPFYLKKIFLKI